MSNYCAPCFYRVDFVVIRSYIELPCFEVAKIFNEFYVNNVEKTCGKPPNILGCPEKPEQDRETFEYIIQHFKEHPSIGEIKEV